MSWETIRNRCESTPYKLIDLGNRYRIELYYTLRAGTYGHQVHAVWMDYHGEGTEYDPSPVAHFHKTNGYGYCKSSAALEHVLRAIGKKPQGFDLGATDDPHKYHKGGNYYSVPQSKLRAAK